jgi:hypothetical protein
MAAPEPTSQLVRGLIEVETAHAALGRLPARPDHSQAIYQALCGDFDSRKAEALCLSADAHPLQELRVHLRRGKLAEARRLLGALEAHAAAPGLRAELEMERARYFAFVGDWRSCWAASCAGLEGEPAPITRMSLFQIRTVAHYELGDFAAASRDIERTEDLGRLFPKAVCSLYSLTFRARIAAVTGHPAAAARILGRAWREDAGNPGPDDLLTLVRTEADLLRSEGKPTATYALASHFLAEAMGEGLYAALSLAELHQVTGGAVPESLRHKLLAGCEQFARVSRLLEAAEEELSTSQRLVRRPAGASRGELPDRVDRIFLLRQARLVRLEPFAAESRPISPQSAKALAALADGPLARAELFRRVWDRIRYSPALHDGLIKSLLSKVRKESGLPVESRGDRIRVPGALVLSGLTPEFAPEPVEAR